MQWSAVKGFHEFGCRNWTDGWFPFFCGFDSSAGQLEKCFFCQQSKKWTFINSLKQDMLRYMNPSLKLTHVLACFTKGTHHLLHLHTNYCIFLSRGRQPVNGNLPWGIRCTHRHRPLLSLALSLSFSLSLELLSTIRRPSAWISSLLWEPRRL